MEKEKIEQGRENEGSVLIFLFKISISIIFFMVGLLALGLGAFVVFFCNSTGGGVLGGCARSDIEISYTLCLGGTIFMYVNLVYLKRVFAARRAKNVKEEKSETHLGSDKD